MSSALAEWLDVVSGSSWHWYAKRLAANDTLLKSNVHQAGPYMNREAMLELFSSLTDRDEKNPRVQFPVIIDSHGFETDVQVIWYNNQVVEDGTRNECRITGWGGKASPILDPEATGSLCILAFHRPEGRADPNVCRVWLCSSPDEEDAVEDLLAESVEPGAWVYSQHLAGERTATLGLDGGKVSGRCRLKRDELPESWLAGFPKAIEIVEFAARRARSSGNADARLLARRKCEFALFRSLEDVLALPKIRAGFETVEEFVGVANTILQRRKARSGRSLELQALIIFDEERLSYSYNETSEGRKRPDFLFPSADDYRDATYPSEQLRMLATKTTCKDRWRQILNEAHRIEVKHLLTVQEGVTESQYREMKRAQVRLVVPRRLHKHYPESVQEELLTLHDFIHDTRSTCSPPSG